MRFIDVMYIALLNFSKSSIYFNILIFSCLLFFNLNNYSNYKTYRLLRILKLFINSNISIGSKGVFSDHFFYNTQDSIIKRFKQSFIVGSVKSSGTRYIFNFKETLVITHSYIDFTELKTILRIFISL
jgi:hypothetical protein